MDIVTAQEMYERDRVAMEAAGLDGKLLMENAGRAVTYDLLRHIQKEHAIVVLIGAGNNGGDGFVIARTLLNLGYDVEAWQVVPDTKITGDAEAHKKIFQASGHPYRLLKSSEDLNTSLGCADVCIDAMLGIGVKGRLKEPYAEIVRLCNEKSFVRLSVDLPSGVPADEGEEDFEAFQAHYTSIIDAPKQSVFLQSTRPYYGEWSVVEIGLPPQLLPDHRRRLWGAADVKRTLPERDAHSHKGSHGKGLIIGGSRLMPGSVAMTARAALRSGAGLIAVSTDPEAIPSISPYVQEATFVEGKDGGQVPVLEGYDGIAVGMGLGRTSVMVTVVEQLVHEKETPLLVDADGLYLIKGFLQELEKREAPTVLTPHPGEFAHLSGLSIKEILNSPFSHSKEFAEKHGVYLVLKGPSTIITGPDGEQRVNISGNAGLAKGGSGDVLSGILLSMMMQGEDVMNALSNGCFLHGSTADLLVQDEHAKIDLLASDVIEGLSRTFRTFSS
ncbi:NAD(P)H-hydrate dehydratase [Halobacillus faecis]|uniref:Bifunctional NAD(P)H-hydrate repair enzyme n=1 Tax=Halobacillus faecis TaxID=360184 RepID=A0A511WV78_9BACI|nr:NAD(P)H-hydrate dehydratase [Halobacillus faecis]GEN55065.1 bifunctional NAD(P)H-hydrate repair enzyme Nnr [Halobacillus faecis]